MHFWKISPVVIIIAFSGSFHGYVHPSGHRWQSLERPVILTFIQEFSNNEVDYLPVSVWSKSCKLPGRHFLIQRLWKPGRYQRLDLFIKVLRVLCPNLTDASAIQILIKTVLKLMQDLDWRWSYFQSHEGVRSLISSAIFFMSLS